MKLLASFLTLALSCFCIAQAACPKTEKEFVETAPALLVKFAFKETNGKTTDFSPELGKNAAGGATTIKVGNEDLYFARADYKTESVSGVLKCDKVKNKVIFLSLGWDNGLNGNGVKGLGLE
jgi:hypothetical protein